MTFAIVIDGKTVASATSTRSDCSIAEAAVFGLTIAAIGCQRELVENSGSDPEPLGYARAFSNGAFRVPFFCDPG